MTVPISAPFCAGDIVPPAIVPLNVQLQIISSWALSAESSGVVWCLQFPLSRVSVNAAVVRKVALIDVRCTPPSEL